MCSSNQVSLSRRVRCDREASLNIQQSRRAGGAREKESCVLFVMCVRFVRNHGRLVKGGRNLAKDPVPVTLSQRRNALRRCGLNVPSILDIPQACFFFGLTVRCDFVANGRHDRLRRVLTL